MKERSAAIRLEDKSQANFPTVSLYGVRISKMNMQDTVRFLTEAVDQAREGTDSVHEATDKAYEAMGQAREAMDGASGGESQSAGQSDSPHPDRIRRDSLSRPLQVVTVNPIMLMLGLEHPDFLRMLQEAELVVPDGAGVVWAAGYIKQPVAERVPGIELMHELFRVGQQKGWRVYLLGTTAETVAIAAERIAERYPGLIVAGYRDGFFGDAEDAEVIRTVRGAKPDLLFVARSAMNQDPWIHRYKQELNIPVMMGIGGSFDVIAGKVKRAPRLFRKLRLEWFYRLLQEPSRYKRMLALPKFVAKIVRDKDIVQKR